MKIRIFLALFVFAFLFIGLVYSEAERPTFAQAERLFLEGRYDRASYEADRLIELREGQIDEVYYIKGVSLLKINKFTAARENFGKLISKLPRSKRVFDAHLGIADSYYLEGDTNTALKNYLDISEKFANDKNAPLLCYRLGDCYKKLGQEEKAEGYFDKARRASPLSFEARMVSAGDGLAASGSELYDTVKTKSSAGSDGLSVGAERYYFSVQVGSFKNKKNAERLTQKLRGLGYDSFMETSRGSGGTLYRVKAGRYKAKADAMAAAARLKRQGYATRVCTSDVNS